ncbi:hypothetical protein TYRP_016308, partial [Tyrophagus putrescentiae]
LQTNFNFSF